MQKIYLLVATLILILAIVILYGQQMVFRYPAFSLEPVPHPTGLKFSQVSTIETRGAYLKSRSGVRFRAYTPGVSMQLKLEAAGRMPSVTMENIHPQAVLEVEGIAEDKVRETRNGLERKIKFSGFPVDQVVDLAWKFPDKPAYRFLVIGDTGGDRELSWGLIRAAQLQADFVLHLGDLYYHESELGGVVAARMNQSHVPVYTSIGNHDYRGPEGNSVDLYLQNIGPLNASFNLLGHCFVNLDTGAYMYPPDGGDRAAFLRAAVVNYQSSPQHCSDHIVFTHKPMVKALETEFPNYKHALHGRDAHWLVEQLQKLAPVTVFAGHIHSDFEFNQDGLKTFVVGGGMAQADLAAGGKHRARVLMGEIRPGQPLTTEWALNEMPMEYHCSKKIYQSMERSESTLLNTVETACQVKP